MTESTAPALPTDDAVVGRWVLDGQASSVAIAHKTMWGVMTVKGSFSQVTGQGVVAPGGAVSGQLRIGAASVDTGNAKRDTHLRSADFLDVEQFPEIAVDVASVTASGSGLDIRGELTVKGVSKPLSVDSATAEVRGDSASVQVVATVDRRDYGLTWNQLGMMKDLTTVTVSARFDRA